MLEATATMKTMATELQFRNPPTIVAKEMPKYKLFEDTSTMGHC